MSAAGFEPGSSRSQADSLTSRPSWRTSLIHLPSPLHESLVLLYSRDQISASTMKVALLCLLALVAVVVGSDVSSYDKVNLGAALLSRMTAQALRGARQEDECTGICVIHYSEPDSCGIGFIHDACEEGEYSIGQFPDDCHCCVIPSETSEPIEEP
ncbi:hypothetical protein FHG87_018174 [Trinorchestia longiramus]|nr:hypothetical protein FHG87_018174 [Trinorchestia longiramus]